MEYAEKDLEIAFAALSPATRILIMGEFERAINDTAVEYHRNVGEPARICYDEMQSIRKVFNVAIRVQEEFSELSRNDQSEHTPDKPGQPD